MQPKRIVKLLLLPISLAILLGATLGTAYAAPTRESTEAPKGLFGTVASVTEDGLIVKSKGGDVPLSVTLETLYRAPENDDASIGDISRGDRIAALVQQEGDRTNAISIMFVPTQGKTVHITGVIAEVADGNTVILTEKGRRVSAEFGLQGNIPQVGTLVTVVGRLDPDTNVHVYDPYTGLPRH